MLEIRSEQIQYVKDMLDDLPGNKTQTAIINATNRAMQTARGKVWEAVHEKYTVKKTAFYRETQIKSYRANASATGAGLEYKGHLIPLIDYKHGSSRSVRVSVMHDEVEVLRHAYVANLGTYGEAIFERLAPRRDSSSQLYGPSAAHMAQNAEVSDDIMTAVQETFDKRLEHEVDRMLRGYGV